MLRSTSDSPVSALEVGDEDTVRRDWLTGSRGDVAFRFALFGGCWKKVDSLVCEPRGGALAFLFPVDGSLGDLVGRAADADDPTVEVGSLSSAVRSIAAALFGDREPLAVLFPLLSLMFTDGDGSSIESKAARATPNGVAGSASRGADGA